MDGTAIPVAGEGDAQRAPQLAQQLAMHVVAARPLYLDSSHIPPEALLAQKARLAGEVAAMEKPAAVQDKIMQGLLSKWYAPSAGPAAGAEPRQDAGGLHLGPAYIASKLPLL